MFNVHAHRVLLLDVRIALFLTSLRRRYGINSVFLHLIFEIINKYYFLYTIKYIEKLPMVQKIDCFKKVNESKLNYCIFSDTSYSMDFILFTMTFLKCLLN